MAQKDTVTCKMPSGPMVHRPNHHHSGDLGKLLCCSPAWQKYLMVCTHATHVYTRTYMNVRVCVFAHTCIGISVCAYSYKDAYGYIRNVAVYIYMCECVCVCVQLLCLSICVQVYKSWKTSSQVSLLALRTLGGSGSHKEGSGWGFGWSGPKSSCCLLGKKGSFQLHKPDILASRRR